jgi:3-hydroxyacyl-[acyl-carrier-protein] dehydratase
MRVVGQFVIAHDRACLDGHFPGRPIAPGVVVLDEALSLIADHLPGWSVSGLASAKFLSVVLPGQAVEVQCGPMPADPASGRVDFACFIVGRAVVRGVARLQTRGV